MIKQSKQRQLKSVLVTGGAGFIGSAFIRYLLSDQSGFDGVCINLDLLTYAGNVSNLRAIEEDPRYRFYRGDINDSRLIKDICASHAVDTIVHFAAESHVDRSIHGPKVFLDTNIYGTFQLLELVRCNPHIHFHHVSTDEVYGCLGDSGQFTEESPYSPNSPYSASKASSDHLVRAYANTYRISTTLSNCSNNYGPFQYPEKFIPLMILNALNEQPLPIYGRGNNVRDWIYVEDHVKAVWLILQEGPTGETYNIGADAEWRNIDLIHEILKIIAYKTQRPYARLLELITFVEDRPGHDYRYAIDASKIRKQLGWEPEHTLTEGLAETVDWYIENLTRNGHFPTDHPVPSLVFSEASRL